jgi:hypothetical protein
LFEDFTDLHDLMMAAGGHHPGVLVVCFDNDPRHILTDRGIASAINKLDPSIRSADPRSDSRAEPVALSTSDRDAKQSDCGS